MTDYWIQTANLFQNVIEKPKMTEKLLSKPPFKYIRDIFIQLCKETGYGQGLYSQFQIDTCVNNKQGKSNFLKKLIKLVKMTAGQPFNINSQMILVGKNTQETNIFLQILCKQALKYDYQHSQTCVQKILTEFGQQKHINQMTKYVLNNKYENFEETAPQIPKKATNKKVIFVLDQDSLQQIQYWSQKLKKQKFIVQFKMPEQNNMKKQDDMGMDIQKIGSSQDSDF